MLYDPGKLIERLRALGLGFWWKSMRLARQPGEANESSHWWQSSDIDQDKLFEALDLLNGLKQYWTEKPGGRGHEMRPAGHCCVAACHTPTDA